MARLLVLKMENVCRATQQLSVNAMRARSVIRPFYALNAVSRRSLARHTVVVSARRWRRHKISAAHEETTNARNQNTHAGYWRCCCAA